MIKYIKFMLLIYYYLIKFVVDVYLTQVLGINLYLPTYN